MGFELSEAKKSEVVRNYSKIAWKTVHRFSKGRGVSREDGEDLHQECMVVLVNHLNNCSSAGEIYRIQVMELVNAMTRYVLGGGSVSVPRDTKRFKEMSEVQPITVSTSELQDVLKQDVFNGEGWTEDDSITRIDFERFYETLTQPQKNLVDRKMIGLSNIEIANEDGISSPCVTKMLNRVRRKSHNQLNVPSSVKRRRG